MIDVFLLQAVLSHPAPQRCTRQTEDGCRQLAITAGEAQNFGNMFLFDLGKGLKNVCIR